MSGRPPCMTFAEWMDWRAFNLILHPSNRADSPCRDCTPAFAATQPICTGIPGKRGRGPAYTADEALATRRATWRESSRRRRAA